MSCRVYWQMVSLAAGAVGHAAGVAEIDDVLAGQNAPQLSYRSQAAQAGIEYADGTVIHGKGPFRSMASFTRRRQRVGRSRPADSISLGYMLMAVKPGRVFSSLHSTRPVPFSTKKSQRDRPWQPSAR